MLTRTPRINRRRLECNEYLIKKCITSLRRNHSATHTGYRPISAVPKRTRRRRSAITFFRSASRNQRGRPHHSRARGDCSLLPLRCGDGTISVPAALPSVRYYRSLQDTSMSSGFGSNLWVFGQEVFSGYNPSFCACSVAKVTNIKTTVKCRNKIYISNLIYVV